MFTDLLEARENESPADTQKRAERDLPLRVTNSNLKWWGLGGERPNERRYLLVGIASYSKHELSLLDRLDAWTEAHANMISIYVYDVARVESVDGFEKIYPGIEKVLQTPVVVRWEGGSLTTKKWGYDASVMLSGVMKDR